MKQIDQFIDERLNLNNDSKIRHNYQPNDVNELRKLLEQLMKERGRNADLNDIDTSLLTSMHYNSPDGRNGLFRDLDPHNIKINKWDVSKVIDMSQMFTRCPNFNADLSDWKVENVKQMGAMFYNCVSFTGKGLDNWKTLNLEEAYYMFARCSNFTGKTIEKIYVNNLQDMNHMFLKCTKLNCNLSKWQINKDADMEEMFDGCTSMNSFPKWYH